MNALLQAALVRKQECDAVFDEAITFLEQLLQCRYSDGTKAYKHGLSSGIFMCFENVAQPDIDLAVDMMGHQFNQFNWVAKPGAITVEWGC